jgi:hypothetical protein
MAAVHSHPGLVAVLAGDPDDQGQREFSSGLLIAAGLVLCSRHGVTTSDGSILADVEVALMAGGRGEVRPGDPVPGTVAWLGAGDRDAALIEVAADGHVPAGFVPAGLAWGEPIGTRPVNVTVTGMPGFAAASTGYQAEPETARGTLEPGTYAASDRYAVNLTEGWPQGWQDWKGVSGAAVRCSDGGYLVGVAAWSDEALSGRRLTAVPVRALLADAGFRAVLVRHLERVPEAEPVELAALLSRPRPVGSPGALLRADEALTAFVGRDDEMRFLEAWRDQPAAAGPYVKVLLVTGRGGEGKTRLAAELVARSKQAGWSGGLLSSGAQPALAEVAGYPGRPLLLVIDYAAARAAGIDALVRVIIRARPQLPVRLLLLARAAGQWWADFGTGLDDDLPGLESEVFALRPLLATGGDGSPDRAAVFIRAAGSLAPHLAPFTGRTADEMRGLAVRLPVPDLSGRAFEHVLTVQMAALAGLLQLADPLPGAGDGVEDMLLRHERKYRDKLAGQQGLDDVRQVRDRAVTGAVLFGARGPTPADARQSATAMVAAALAPDLDGQVARQREVAAWIAGIYPPDNPESGAHAEYWGTVLPDRLGEFLAVRLLANEVLTAGDGDGGGDRAGEEGLLESLAGCSDLPGFERALLILSRATKHDARAGQWAGRLVRARPRVAGMAALRVAAYAENPAPLRGALVQLGIDDSALLGEVVSSVHEALPRFSLQRLETSAGMTRELTLIYRELAGVNRDAYLPDLAMSLNNHAALLAETGRRAEAVPVSEEAVALRRELAGVNRDAYLPDLVTSLGNLGRVLLVNQRVRDSVAACLEALQLRGELPGYLLDRVQPAVAALRQAYETDPDQAEAAFREFTGGDFPDELK